MLDNCQSPTGHAFLPDGNLAVTCNGGGTIVYVTLSEFE